MMKNWKKRMLVWLAVAGIMPTCSAQETSPGYRVFHEVDTVWHFGYKGVNLYSRKMHRIDIAYPSKDVDGSAIELSGSVCIPYEIYSGEQPTDGILLYNHYAVTSRDEAPTRGDAFGEDLVMANPLKPNYIVVCSDLIGFGLTENKVQVLCLNDINGQASIDCFLAARKLLGDRDINQGKYVINAGYSAGGFDAVAAQRVRDMKYRDQITFHKTLCGGMPFNVMDAYKKLIEWKDDPTTDPCSMPLMLCIYNYHDKNRYTGEQLFKQPYASKMNKWFLSGDYDLSAVKDSLKGAKLSDIIQEPFFDKNSEEYKWVKELTERNSLEKDWLPDSTQRYFVLHLLRDNVIPIEGDRAFLKFLTNARYDGKTCAGFEKTIIPERTRLQTNFFIPSSAHTVLGGLLFFTNLAATLAATPVLFYDDELNSHYADFVEPATLMGIIHLLEEKGLDVRGAVKSLTNNGNSIASSDFFSFLTQIEETMNSIGTTTSEMLQILDDSGVGIADILQAYTYLTTPVESARGANREQLRPLSPMETGLAPFYQRQLIDWLHDNHVNLNEE